MLPNHSPLVIAEQFGTLDAMYPGRIDLGLGRAPGSDQNTMYALRRDPTSADTLPAGRAGAAGLPGRRDPGPRRRRRSRARARTCRCTSWARRCSAPRWPPRSACPTRSPSHFAPQALEAAVATYRREFQPSGAARRPVRDRRRQRHRRRHHARRRRSSCRRSRRIRAVGAVRPRAGVHRRGGRPAARRRAPGSTSTRCSPTPPSARRREVGEYLDGFAKQADADELIVAHQAPDDRGPAAVGHPAGRGDGDGLRLAGLAVAR